jgi:magnesium transporter
MAQTRCYRDGTLVDKDFSLADVSEHLEELNTIVWIDLVSPGRDELDLLADELDLHVLAVEDAINLNQRPKLDHYPDHEFLSAYAAAFDPTISELTTSEIAVFITKRALITIRRDDSFPIAAVVERWDSAPHLAANGVDYLLYGLLDVLVDGYFQCVQSLDGRIESLAEELFDPKADQEIIQKRSFELRRSLVALRRVVLPMREVVNSLMRQNHSLVQGEMGPYFQDVYDHVLRATEWTESLRDLVSGMLETNLSIQGNRLNVITKKVTGYAAIIAVPTAITGFYGQNVPYPGFGTFGGLISSVILIVALSGLLFVVFKKSGWI